ncbi:MAG: crossover junction endodeoxyribonuclease RuvC [Chloroflexi bacterium HGW-Chloroflexi-1]|nr:MAG: crossover junction endodeoxyribonuclease RuvC [Chloroflexi bacterium HGW-Chloroflexi-1]
MVILGIDPGTATTGYALVGEDEAGEPQLLRYGIFTTRAGTPMPERLLTIHREMAALIREATPDAIAVEELFFKRNVTTALTVGQARGVVLLAAAQAGLAVYEYKPAEVKLALVGYGNADKQQIQEMLRMMLDLPDIPRPDDAADAIAVAICHLQSARFSQLVAESSAMLA